MIIILIILQIYEFNVEMTCGGCSGAVEKVLAKLGGESIDISMISSLLQSSLIESFVGDCVCKLCNLEKGREKIVSSLQLLIELKKFAIFILFRRQSSERAN